MSSAMRRSEGRQAVWLQGTFTWDFTSGGTHGPSTRLRPAHRPAAPRVLHSCPHTARGCTSKRWLVCGVAMMANPRQEYLFYF